MKIFDVLSYLPKFLTNQITKVLTDNGFPVSNRWAGLIFFFIVSLLIFLGMKISHKLIKWILILFGIFLALGILIVPSW